MCRAPFVWDFKLWYDKRKAPSFSLGRSVRIVRLNGTHNATVTSLQTIVPGVQQVNLKSAQFDDSMPADILVRLGPDLFGDLSVTSTAYVAGLVKVCVDQQARRRFLKGFQ